MSMQLLDSAQTFILNNARLLERHLFAYLFKGGVRQPVVTALAAYQNADGGFGNALEPDKRCADSQPIDQEFALRVLDVVGFDESMVRKACDFLMSITTPEGGVPFSLPTVRSAPRTPWFDTVDKPPALINPTASIAGLLYKNKFRHPWLEKATQFCWQQIDNLQNPNDHDLLCIVLFLEHVPERERAEKAFQDLAPTIIAHTAFDPHAAGYVKMPLDYAPTPDSICRQLYDEQVIADHLGALAARQQADGCWSLTWPAVSPADELEYKGIMTIEALKTLKAYGLL